MPNAAQATELSKTTIEVSDSRELKAKIQDTHTEELIIGLCGPIGTDIHFVATEIAHVIAEKFNYTTEIIRLSDFIKEQKKVDKSQFDSVYKYMDTLIDEGNNLRDDNGHSILAELAISRIAYKRELKKKIDGDFKSQRICYIIDSIKNTEELELFRLVYSDMFYFIGVFSNIAIREKYLEKTGVTKPEIQYLVDRDSGEDIKNGQKVSDTFMQADFFLRNDALTSAAIRQKIERYLDLIFSSEIITPSVDETAMYQAFAAAGNSACLSRQVGASITNKNGEIISIGWNDVPKFNGGVYTFSEKDLLGIEDKRCLNLEGGKCFNDSEKELIRNALVKNLVDSGLIKKEDQLRAEEVIRKSRIKELIEFSRAVHAEMHAIIIGSQNSGRDIVGGNLYCTTYPCHNCARHIVAAGIKNVYYIEPYRKSLALKLHDDSISEDEKDEGKKLRILMFDGVAPRRYLEFFRMLSNSRKDNGLKKIIQKKKISPKKTVSLRSIPVLESKIVEDLVAKKVITIGE